MQSTTTKAIAEIAAKGFRLDASYAHRLKLVADDMARSHAKIFLRFASEMNGDWTNYHNNPAEYRRKFRLVHQVMRRRAPNVATVWCPYTFPRWNYARVV